MTITQVSNEYGISTDTLRYYEKIGLIPKVNRTKGGIRDYTEEDCNWVKFASCMRSSGLPIDALVQYRELFSQGDSTRAKRKEILIEQRDQLIKRMSDMKETLARLDAKIKRYE